jgi:serine/threonine-protein kinase
MSEFCSLCQAVEEGPYCPEQGLVRRPFAIGGRYEVEELVGARTGSFVFGARDRAARRSVAVKVLRSQLTSAQVAEVYEAQQGFLRELAAGAVGGGVGIVDFGWDNALGVSYLVASRGGDPMQWPSLDELESKLADLDAAAWAREQGTQAETPREMPAMIGSYQVIGSLGMGGTGRVYLGEHPVIGSKVAIKVLLPEIARSTETVERFIQEARASSQIGSPHIPRYFDFGTTPAGLPYAIMEYFDGETLGERLARVGTLSLSETAQIVEQIATALLMAHDAGLVHRDLKPDNILLVKPDKSGRSAPMLAAASTQTGSGAMPAIEVKVLDFGIAKVIGNRSAARTLTGAFLGTPFYCAPEQVFGHDVDARTDVYSLGVTAYEMLTGAPPFVGVVPVILSTKATEEAPDLADAGVPAVVAHTIRRMLAREPRHRAPSMAWVLEQVAVWRQSGELGAAGSTQLAAPARRTARTADYRALVPQVHTDAGATAVDPDTAFAVGSGQAPLAVPLPARAILPPHRRSRRVVPIAAGALVMGAAIAVLGVRLHATPRSPSAPAPPSASGALVAPTVAEPGPPDARPSAAGDPIASGAGSGSQAATTPNAVAASPSNLAGASPSNAAGASPSNAGGASPSNAAGASPSNAAGASESNSPGANPPNAPATRAVARHPGAKSVVDKRPTKRPPSNKPPSGELKDVLIVDPFSPGSSSPGSAAPSPRPQSRSP